MDDDFNTAGAIAALHGMAGCVNRYMDQAGLDGEGTDQAKDMAVAAGATLVSTGRILGLFEQRPAADTAGLDAAEIERLIAEREAARQAKDFARADAVRDQLAGMGVAIEDTPGGTVWRKA